MVLEQLVHAERRPRHPPKLRDTGAIAGEQLPDLGREIDRLAGRLLDPFQEEPDPALPIAGGPHLLQELVVPRSVLLEVEAEVEERLPERALVAENERD